MVFVKRTFEFGASWLRRNPTVCLRCPSNCFSHEPRQAAHFSVERVDLRMRPKRDSEHQSPHWRAGLRARLTQDWVEGETHRSRCRTNVGLWTVQAASSPGPRLTARSVHESREPSLRLRLQLHCGILELPVLPFDPESSSAVMSMLIAGGCRARLETCPMRKTSI